MCPIVNESATASLIAHTLGMETVDDSSNNLEFPRENLEFVKVLGVLRKESTFCLLLASLSIFEGLIIMVAKLVEKNFGGRNGRGSFMHCVLPPSPCIDQ